MSSFLLPQFKCQPDTFCIQFRTHPTTTAINTHLAKSRERSCFRTQCSLATTSPPISTSAGTTAVLDLKSLRLPSLEDNSYPVPTNGPWMYIGAVDPPAEETVKATLITETLLTSEEAKIASASAEAVSLAKAAAKVAEDAVTLFKKGLLEQLNNTPATLSPKPVTEVANGSMQLANVESVFPISSRSKPSNLGIELDTVRSSRVELLEHEYVSRLEEESDDLTPTHEELENLQEQLSRVIVVRSKRRTERKARRVRATEKVAATIVSPKSTSTRRKQRPSVRIDQQDPLRYLRATVRSYKLLTSDEEFELSQGIQDLLKLEKLQEELVERYGGQPTFAQWASAAGFEQKTLKNQLNHGRSCKDRMIKSNIRLVISIAKNYSGHGINLLDLVQEGCRGLVRAAEKFDATKGFRFSTYAHWWIRTAVRKCLCDQSRLIRLPVHMVEATYKVKEAKRQIYIENGRQPDDAEIAEATGLSIKRVGAVLAAPKVVISLEQSVGSNQNHKPMDVLVDPNAETVEDLVIKQLMKQELEKMVDSLNSREQYVIRCRFGMDDGRTKTLQEIGELMGVSRERVRQIEAFAFRKLKSKKRLKHLEQYLRCPSTQVDIFS